MPTFKRGNYWEAFDESDLFCFTSNGVVKQNGSLVMGAGTAKSVRDRFKGIDKVFGEKAKQYHCFPPNKYLYFLITVELEGKLIGALQTKVDYKSFSNITLIQQSLICVAKYVKEHELKSVHMPYPGIGCGKLDKSAVAPMLERLPDTITIWEN